MEAQNELHYRLPNEPLGKLVLQGAGIALLLAIIFLSIIFSVGEVLNGKTFWQGVWQFLPLVTVTAGGALGGMVYYAMVQIWNPSGWRRELATIFSLLFYVLLLWLCLIVGFSATRQWD
ncbi:MULTISPECIES: hypothetical protein [Flavobacterium]|uniref:hypothetical protein n=1 Tax=Flavobacterium TaxID=237 RepID=UPI001FCB4A28|nr:MULTISPECIES: hypothetical protein [Flavobacterium]UOK42339.1 hypothetical protein LZF87_13615 [Flavobacterium enshiense]